MKIIALCLLASPVRSFSLVLNVSKIANFPFDLLFNVKLSFAGFGKIWRSSSVIWLLILVDVVSVKRLLGNTIYSNVKKNSTLLVNTSHLPKGIYIVLFEGLSRKLIVE